MITTDYKREYKNLLSDIASIRNEEERLKLFLSEYHKLVGITILRDLQENKGMENFDPLIQNKVPVLLNIIGNFLNDFGTDNQFKWGTYLSEECRHLMTNYYRVQIESDLDHMVCEFSTARRERN